MNHANSIDAPEYKVEPVRAHHLPPLAGLTDDQIIGVAIEILRKRIQPRDAMSSPAAVKSFLVLRAADLDVEHFGVMFLDAQNRVITTETMFTGTLTQTSVYPREVVRRALALNAASVILTHNHPSGDVQPSRADEALTQTLKAALALIDVRVLDHVITGGASSLSMAEKGLI